MPRYQKSTGFNKINADKIIATQLDLGGTLNVTDIDSAGVLDVDAAGNLTIDTSSGFIKIGDGSTSGTAITIGHTTSETTIGDNMTVTGDLTVSGNCLQNTWTPTMGGVTNTWTLSTAQGQYTTIGNMVFFDIYVIWSSTGSALGEALRISLPSTSNSRGAVSIGGFAGLGGQQATGEADLQYSLSSLIVEGNSYVQFVRTRQSGASVTLNENDGNNDEAGDITMSGFYSTTNY